MSLNSASDLIILGLDVSFKRTGYAVFKNMELLDYGIIEPPETYKKITHKDKEFCSFLDWYCKAIEKLVKAIGKLDYAAIEDLNMEFVRAAKPILQVHAAAKIGIIMGYALTDISYIHNRTLKAFFEMPMFKRHPFPKGVLEKAKEYKKRPEKILMIDIINRMYFKNAGMLQLTYNQDDEADAIALCVTKFCQIKTELEKIKNGK